MKKRKQVNITLSPDTITQVDRFKKKNSVVFKSRAHTIEIMIAYVLHQRRNNKLKDEELLEVSS